MTPFINNYISEQIYRVLDDNKKQPCQQQNIIPNIYNAIYDNDDIEQLNK